MLSQSINNTLSDEKFVWLLSNIRDAFFIQIGANDGISYDPIHKSVIDFKMSGILVEPGPQAFTELKINYAHNDNLFFENVAITDYDGYVDLFCGTTTPHFTLDENKAKHMFDVDPVKTKVRAMTMDTLIKKYNPSKINLLQVDAEGHDHIIIHGFDFDKYLPEIVRFERVCMDSFVLESCLTKLNKYGYKFFNSEDGSDIICVSNDFCIDISI